MKNEQVLISIFLIAILVFSSGSIVAFASGSHTIVVPPSHDTTGKTDTAAIQAALNKCTSGNQQCTVQLLSGTYYISSQITVYGFQGSFVGAGQGQTTIEVPLGTSLASPALGDNIPCTLTTGPACIPNTGTPYWAGLPGSSNPWPAIFTFVGGTFSISGMTISDSNPDAIYPGWYNYQDPTQTLYTSLFAAILITGGTPMQPQAFAAFDHVTVVGGSGDADGTNMWNGIIYGGSFVQPTADGNFYDFILLPGTFSVTNSLFENIQSGPWIDDTIGATATVCYNTFINNPSPTGFTDVSNTKMTFCGNQGYVNSPYYAIMGYESTDPAFPNSPSSVYIINNNFQLAGSTTTGYAADAVGLFDWTTANYGTPSVLSAVISGNTFQESFPCVGNVADIACIGYSVIFLYALKSTTVSSNYISGGGSPGAYINGGPGTVAGNTITGAYTGVQLDVASGVHIAGNVIKNSLEYGIAVTSSNIFGFPEFPSTATSNNNRITGNFVTGTATGGFDLYWDTFGTGNAWCGNFYHTSSPSVLPSC